MNVNTDLNEPHTLIIGAVDALATGIASAFVDAGGVVSFAFDARDGDDAIRQVSEAGLTPERMRAVNFEDPETLDTQVTSFEPLDSAVLLPRWYGYGRALELSHADWDAALTQNVEEAIYTLQALSNLFIEQGGGWQTGGGAGFTAAASRVERRSAAATRR